ncbi:MAG: thiamine pyrophosphate-dependent dehydrogenase E1 component subunit alpha [Syntrophomonadaceae bacterium]|nr:thiamine pyrophosphate-dependent dehydrogenase E1 component subunit alpha [Syntrophomonadaceae bacterium]
MDEKVLIPPQALTELYTLMLEIRRVELKIAEHYPEDEMRTPIHLCIGQEAIAAGVCANLKTDDYVFSNHRGHGHYIAKKGSLNTMIAELYNKETGCSLGRGGSMHLVDTSVGLMGSSSIVAGGIPIATGAALASVFRNDGRVSVAFFGDGAAEEGVLFESINFAVLKKLPVIYVCENNLYAVCSPLNRRQPGQDIHKRVEGFSIPACSIDGNDVISVYQAARQAVDNARKGGGPYFIECKTYRLTDHHDRKTGIEIGYRTQEEWDEWAAKCPINNLEGILRAQNFITKQEIKGIKSTIDERIKEAFEFARTSPLPDRNELYKYLYC